MPGDSKNGVAQTYAQGYRIESTELEVAMRKGLAVALVVAGFLAGGAVMIVSGAGAEKVATCDPASISEVIRELPSTGGFKTPEEALAIVAESERDIDVPKGAVVVSDDGSDRAVVDAVDSEGNVAYTVYIDDEPRIHTFVQKLTDGTYGLAGYQTCLRMVS